MGLSPSTVEKRVTSLILVSRWLRLVRFHFRHDNRATMGGGLRLTIFCTWVDTLMYS